MSTEIKIGDRVRVVAIREPVTDIKDLDGMEGSVVETQLLTQFATPVAVLLDNEEVFLFGTDELEVIEP